MTKGGPKQLGRRTAGGPEGGTNGRSHFKCGQKVYAVQAKSIHNVFRKHKLLKNKT